MTHEGQGGVSSEQFVGMNTTYFSAPWQKELSQSENTNLQGMVQPFPRLFDAKSPGRLAIEAKCCPSPW